jgi:hypothetical protein
MSTSRNRLGMHGSRTPAPLDTVALFLILELDGWDIRHGNYSNSDAFFDELDLEDRESFEGRARTETADEPTVAARAFCRH